MAGEVPGNAAALSDTKASELYKEYFGLYTTALTERTDYNKYFITLLFTNTLFAIFTTLLGATQTTAYQSLARVMLLLALLTAVGISCIWVCKLWALDYVSDAQEARALEKLEQSLFGSTNVTITSLRVSEMQSNLSFRKQVVWQASYWGFPVIFIVVFLIIFFALILWPGLFPSIVNATQNASKAFILG